MKVEKKDLVTVQQIDGMTAVKTPHERELNTIGDAALKFLPGLDPSKLESVVISMGGSVDDLGFGEDYTVSFEYFPGVRIHVLYFSPDEEDEGF